METGTIVMMVVVLGLLWGGFTGLLVHAVRIERRRAGGAGSPPEDPDRGSGRPGTTTPTEV